MGIGRFARAAGRVLVPLACVLAPVRAAPAQESVDVQRIVFEGNRRYSEATLKYSMRTKEGKPLDRELLARDVSMLHDFFETISVTEEAVPEGLRLTFRVSENPVVSEVLFLGNVSMPEADLRADAETRRGYPLASYRLESDARRIARRYREDGYHFVEVKPEVLDDADAKKVVFRIVEGPRVLVTDVTILGNASFPYARLRRLMDLRSSRLLSPHPYVERKIEEDRVALLGFYRDEGFLDARVSVRDVRFADDRSGATLTVVVEEGGAWTVGEVQVTGGASLPERDKVAARASGATSGSRWRRPDIEAVARKMVAECQRQGFAGARVDVEPVLHPEGRVQDVRFAVQEGRRFTVRSVDVSGNVQTRDKVILREFTVAPGDPLDYHAIQKSVRRVLDTHYFNSVVPLLHDTDRPDQKDVEIRVEESAQTSKLRMGFGVSSDTGLFGTFDVLFNNFDISDSPARLSDLGSGRAFKGAGQTLAFLLSPGTGQSDYRVAFSDPWIFDRPVLFGVDVFATTSRLFRYDSVESGLRLNLRRRWLVPREDLDDVFYAGVRPRLESSRVSSIDRDAAPNVFDIAGRNSVRGLALDLGWSRIDEETLTSRGWVVGGSAELVGGSLGGDFNLHKEALSASRTFEVRRDAEDRPHTLTFRASAGFAGALSGTDAVPITERYFAGGSSGIGAVRGFEYGGVGPRGQGDPHRTLTPAEVTAGRDPSRPYWQSLRYVDADEGDPMGGEAVASAGLEYGVPLYSDLIRGVAFVDAANLAENTGGLARNWRSSAGVGFSIRIPLLGPAPLRFDFGFPLRKVVGDRTRVVSFSFERFF